MSQFYWANHYSGVASPGESRLQHTATARRKDRDWSGLGLEKTPMDPLKNDGMLAARPAPHILVVQEPPCPSRNAQGNSKKATVPQPLWIGCFAIYSRYSVKQAPHGELGTIRYEMKVQPPHLSSQFHPNMLSHKGNNCVIEIPQMLFNLPLNISFPSERVHDTTAQFITHRYT